MSLATPAHEFMFLLWPLGCLTSPVTQIPLMNTLGDVAINSPK